MTYNRAYMLDNKCSSVMKGFVCSSGSRHLLSPSGVHRALITKSPIQNFKARLIFDLARCDPKFPLRLWYRLIQQAYLTLNILFPY